MKKRTLWIIMLVSLAFNAAFIAGAAGKRLKDPDKKKINRLEKMFRNDRKLFTDLDLSAEQLEKITKIQDEYQEKKLDAIKNFHDRYEEAISEAANGNFDGPMLDKFCENASKHTMPALIMREKFTIMELLTPEQRKTVLESLRKRVQSIKTDIQEVLEKMKKK